MRIARNGLYLYGLYRGTELVYLGQSKSVLTRCTGHADKDWDSLALLAQVADQAELDALERRAIHRLHPEHNAKCPEAGCWWNTPKYRNPRGEMQRDRDRMLKVMSKALARLRAIAVRESPPAVAGWPEHYRAELQWVRPVIQLSPEPAKPWSINWHLEQVAA